MSLLAVILDVGSVVPSCIREVHFKAGIFLVTLGGQGLMVHNLSLQLPSILERVPPQESPLELLTG